MTIKDLIEKVRSIAAENSIPFNVGVDHHNYSNVEKIEVSAVLHFKNVNSESLDIQFFEGRNCEEVANRIDAYTLMQKSINSVTEYDMQEMIDLHKPSVVAHSTPENE